MVKSTEKLGDRVKRVREERHLTQEQLAVKIGIRQSHIGNVEKNTRGTTMVAEIAHALGVDAYWLKTGIETITAGDAKINEVVRLMLAPESL